MAEQEDLVAHMRPVLAAERDLRELALVWQMIESSAAIGCPGEAESILDTLTETRRRFDALQTRLIEQMVVENRAEIGALLRDNAQGAIEILVRNLYERSADVGFLATDDAVRAFCAGSDAQRDEHRAAMVRRLAQYQSRYSVYDDILLLDPAGGVLARLDPAAPTDVSDAPLAAAAAEARGHVERFGPSPFAPVGSAALVYAHAVRADEGRIAGVLVLRFRFEDEMRRIFASTLDRSQRIVRVLVDVDGRVIASGDAGHVPLGAFLDAGRDGEVELTRYAGHEYLSICCASQGYQGYPGPPWRVVAMVSLLTAFRSRPERDVADVPLDNPELLAVQTEADAINRELRRVLWNGSVLIESRGEEALRLKAVLRQVTMIGRRTRGRVTDAIHDIYRVSLSRLRHQAQELGRLIADLMDRSLYERANDCRWWALSPVLQRELARAPSPEGTESLRRVLAHINGLYTVYSQLAVFDAAGVIRALSAPGRGSARVGERVPQSWVHPLMNRSDPQSYSVTPFEATALHDDGPTYVYLAGIYGGSPRRFVGGIAIVFAAARELGAMLRDLLGDRPGFAAFVDAEGHVMASAGTVAPVPLALITGAGANHLVEHDGAHLVCASVKAPGYREFKTSDGYDNGVRVSVGLHVGTAERRQTNMSDLDLVAATAPRVGGGARDAVEMAVFQIGRSRYALPAADVIEATPLRALVRMPSLGGATLGVVEIVTEAGPRTVRVFCGRKLFGVNYPARRTDGVVVVLRSSGDDATLLGLRVDDVLAVIEVAAANVHPVPEGLQGRRTWIDGLLDCEVQAAGGNEPVMVQLLSRERLAADLAGQG